ncbi:MAG: sigma-70 family RNA polymerase sigma factor [Chloroflexota bacterium]
MATEKQLIKEAKRFDQAALAEIYDRYQVELYRYAYRQLGDQNQAEDCVSETFSRFLKALHSNKGPRDHLRAYLFRIAHNWITDQYRRKPPPELPLEDEVLPSKAAGPEEKAFLNIEQKTIRVALELLTAEQRQVIMLKFLEGWKNKEIAAALDKPVGAVKALQHRGLASLNRILSSNTEII